MITTVGGDIPGGALGFCQSHEHLFLAKGQSFAINADLWLDDAGKSAEELRLYRAAGGGSVVDAQPVGCGRDALALEKISRESGVPIIASTGFHKLIFYRRGHWIYSMSEAALARLWIEELTEGMYGLCDDAPPAARTNIRAGQVKTALDSVGLTGEYKKLFAAAAAACVRTGRPLMAHIEAGADALALADFLLRAGVAPRQIIFCHLDRAERDLAVHKELCARGAALEYDTIARPKYHDDRREIEILQTMLAAGYADQILMGLDTTRKRLKAYGGETGLDYILKEFIPGLFAAGVPEEAADKIFRQNPARLFSHKEI